MDTRPDEAAEWHAARRRRRKIGCLAVLLTPVVLVAVLLVWFGFRIFATPKITRNYTAEFNERFEAVPESDRAWPIYKQAIIFEMDHPKPSLLEDEWPVYPGWSNWGEAKDWLVEIRPELDLVREGASKPVLGKPLSDAPDQELAKARARQSGLAYLPEEASENPMVVGVLLEELGKLRGFAKSLRVDAFRAATEGDGDLATRNIEAMLAVSAHAAESTTLIGMLVQIAIETMAHQTAVQLLEKYPDALSDGNLAALQRAFMEIGRDGQPDDGGLTRLPVDFSMERVFFEDLVQRIYSDDGSGSGHITLEGLTGETSELYWGMSYGASDPPGTAAVLLFAASRRDILARHKAFMDEFEAISRQRPWDRTKSAAELDAEMNQFDSSMLNRTRYMLLWQLLPALSNASKWFDKADAYRDATIVAIALHRYRRAHGAFPETLESLVPEFVPGLALDPVDGKPLRYVLSDSGPILYSLGGDGDDDGGIDGSLTAESVRNIQPGASSPEDGDWVLYPVAVPVEPEDEDE
jgi:hypothetical protein